MIPNRWAAKCAACGKRVRPARVDASGNCIEQFGYSQRTGSVNMKTGKPVWETRHVECESPDAAVPSERRDVGTPHGRVVIRESGEPGMVFAAFVSGTEAGRACLTLSASNVDATHRARLGDAWPRPGYVVAVGTLRPFIALLHKAGIVVEVSGVVHSQLRTLATQASTAALAASARIAELRTELAARNMALRLYQEEGVEYLTSRPASLLADEMGTGKGQPASALVITPSGPRPIGSLAVGDEVIGSAGTPVKVTGVFKRGRLPVFRVRFSDESSLVVDADHLWSVNSPNGRFTGRPNKVVATRDLMAGPLHDRSGNRRHFIPMVEPVEMRSADRPASLHPYVLGVLLGDGSLCSHTPSFFKLDADLPGLVRDLLPAGMRISSGPTYRLAGDGGLNPVTSALRELGLWGHECYTKFVPACYLATDKASRLDLLQGLMDTDGSVHNKHTEFSSSSRQLAEDVRFLVESLGGTARLVERETWFTVNGERREGARNFRVHISLPSHIVPFRMARKLAAWQPKGKYGPSRSIESIEPCGDDEVVCISVDSPDQLYVADRFIVTHNTAQAILAMGSAPRAIVVCPAGLIYNWRDELARWSPSTIVQIARGRASVVAPPPKGCVLISSYESLCDTFTAAPGCEDVVLVIDEAHYLKGGGRTASSPARGRRAYALARAVREAGGRVIELTGSPLKNDLDELWEVMDISGLAEELFGSKRRMKKLYNDNHDLYIETLRRGMLRREKKDVLAELPPKVYVRRVVEISPESRARLDAVLAEIRALAGRRAVEALRAAGPTSPADEHAAYERAEANVDEAIRLVFESDAPIPFELISRTKSILALAKMDASLAILDELHAEDPTSPVLFFSTHVAPVDAAGARSGWGVIKGDVAPVERQELATRYQAGELPGGMAITIRAGGVGLNLPRGYREVFNDREWTPADNEQAEDRAHRIGQTAESLWICDVVADHPLDHRIFELNAEKRKVMQRAVSAATLKASERAQRAFADDVLAMVVTERPERLDIARRDPTESELEAAEFLLAHGEPDLFARTITAALREHASQLTDAQWRAVVRWADARHPDDERPRPARSQEERWTARALATLASGIDGQFTTHDAAVGASLAGCAAGLGMTDGEWRLAVMLTRKYRSLPCLSIPDPPTSTSSGSGSTDPGPQSTPTSSTTAPTTAPATSSS